MIRVIFPKLGNHLEKFGSPSHGSPPLANRAMPIAAKIGKKQLKYFFWLIPLFSLFNFSEGKYEPLSALPSFRVVLLIAK